MGLLAWAAVVGVGAVVSVCPFLAPAVLPAVGFSAVGPVAGTIAAGAQSYVGSVAAGSFFSAAQAIAMAAPTP